MPEPSKLSSKPVIALDMDEVLYPFAERIFGHYSEVENSEIDYTTLDDYHSFHKLWGINEFETLERVVDFFATDSHDLALPIDGSVAALNRLQTQFRIIIVTARQHIAECATRDWLSTHYGGPIEDVYFCNFFSIDGTPPISKSSICLAEDAWLFVDDSPRNVDQVADSGVHSLLFGEYTWNQQQSPRHRRIGNWVELEAYINEHL